MKLNKISISLAAVMLASVFQTAYAVDEDYENLILAVKNRIGVPEKYTEFKIENKYRLEDEMYYVFGWKIPNSSNERISATADADGNIINYSFLYKNISDNSVSDFDYITMDMDKAKIAAYDFIKKTNPELENNIMLTLSDFNYSNRVTFNITGIFNDIEYYTSLGSIRVNSDMTVTSMDINAPDIEDSDERYISLDEAYKNYFEKVGINTEYYCYTPKESTDNRKVSFPVYSDISGKAIDAVTGEVIDYIAYSGYKNEFTAGAAAEDSAESYKELTAEELKSIKEVNNLLSEAEALKLIKDRIGVDFKPESSSLDYRTGCYYYSFETYEPYELFNVNAENGDIAFFSFDAENEKTHLEDYSLDDSEEALNLIKRLAPTDGALYDSDLTEINSENTAYYRYKINGIPVNGARAHFERNPKQNRFSFSMTSLNEYKSTEYDAPKNFIGISEQFSSPSVMKLRYVKTENGIKAAYIVEPFFVNAITGREVNRYNEEIKDNKIRSYTDIENHWVKKAAQQLAYANIGFPGGMLNPDTAITEKEAYSLIQGIYRADGETKEKKLTRREAADMIVRIKGLSEISKLDIYLQPYSDMNENYGSAAILKGYGIIDGDTDKFRPNDNITRAEFLQMLYNALTAW